ncbi:MAG: ABC transporter permease [Deferribacteraceae bacterium]|jgi:putative ABC transport system permease protein|nr:ABC transporter permease [Deferribacteraceae bacterium]
MYIPYILHELRNRSQRTAINIIGIAIGVALFVAVNAVADGYQAAVALPFKDLGADMVVQQPEHKSTSQESRSMRGIRLPFSNQSIAASDRQALAILEHVSASSQALLLWEFLPSGFRTVMGVDLTQPSLGPVRVNEWISQGRSLENPNEALVEKHFANFIRIKNRRHYGSRQQNFLYSGAIRNQRGSADSSSKYLSIFA